MFLWLRFHDPLVEVVYDFILVHQTKLSNVGFLISYKRLLLMSHDTYWECFNTLFNSKIYLAYATHISLSYPNHLTQRFVNQDLQ